jgi:hypothetical protein
MTENWLDHKPNCFVEFRVLDKKRFEIFMRFFNPLREWTQNFDATGPDIDTIEDDATLASHGYAHDDTQESFGVSAKEETKQRRAFAKPEEWLLAFRPQDLKYLGLPEHVASINTMRSWQGLSRRERRKAIKDDGNTDDLRMLSDFTDMLQHWQDIEYELIECEMHEADRARITYSTFDFPFEGKVALEETLMFFGFFAIVNDSC